MLSIEAYLDRDVDNINGKWTLQVVQDGIPTKIFDRIAVRSGQNGYTNTSWTEGKSPTPFNTKQEPWYIWTEGQNVGTLPSKAIPTGEAYPISSDTKQKTTIYNPDNRNETRTYCEMHQENAIPGTEGCTAIVDPAIAQEVWAYFKLLAKIGIKYIPYYVL
jgi:hypothetical protein